MATDSKSSEIDGNGVYAQLRGELDKAHLLVRKGVRDPDMCDALLRALKLFKENRLGGVVSLRVEPTPIVPQDALALLSLPLCDLKLTRRTKIYFRTNGMELLGEVYRFINVDGKPKKPFTSNSLTEIIELLQGLGMPMRGFDPIAFGWRPPYWDDAACMEALSGSMLASTRDQSYGSLCHQTGTHYLGTFIQGKRGDQHSSFGYKTRVLGKRVTDLGIHAGMYLPPGWTAPQGLPDDWVAYGEAQAAKAAKTGNGSSSADTLASIPDQVTVDQLFTPVGKIKGLLSVTCALLRIHRLFTIGELIQMTPAKLLRIPGIGRKTLREIVHALEEWHLKLGTDPVHERLCQYREDPRYQQEVLSKS